MACSDVLALGGLSAPAAIAITGFERMLARGCFVGGRVGEEADGDRRADVEDDADVESHDCVDDVDVDVDKNETVF